NSFIVPLIGYLSAYPLAFPRALASDNIPPICFLIGVQSLRLGWLLVGLNGLQEIADGLLRSE
ncbi:hypothetical protein, partial [uncultured Thermosynechococcus sp.]|uniref:hypothetical protein n=1 Tax=uncultured Thermosynechococcus sp. TaxID=436945 RepID=UPI00260E9398